MVIKNPGRDAYRKIYMLTGRIALIKKSSRTICSVRYSLSEHKFKESNVTTLDRIYKSYRNKNLIKRYKLSSLGHRYSSTFYYNVLVSDSNQYSLHTNSPRKESLKNKILYFYNTDNY